MQELRGSIIPEGADIRTRRAFDALPPMIEDAIRRADELARDIEDLEAAERGAKRAAHASPHLGALCLFMFGTRARIAEAVSLTWADVNMTARTATIRVTKPKPWTRTAHLPAPVLVALANIPSNRHPEDRVFAYAERGSVKQPWDNVIRRAGI